MEVPYQCPDCRDTGYINGEKCHCFRQEEISILYDQSHLQLLTRTQNFDTLREDFYKGEDLKRFRAARNVSLHFARQFGREYSNLYFFGTVGTGKSFLSVCIAREVLSAGYSVLYFSAASLFDRLAGLVYNYRSREDFQHFVDDLYHCDLLIIDDLGTELTNQFVSAQLFACINERHLNRKPTVISTNLSLEDLQKRYSDRVFSRITSGYICCKLTGKDIRLLKKVRTMNGTHQET
ncbi:MAG: ATP-binding protein [Lachnospiraceae bacterium]|nr:ATP-binding protein [Lachnospiraceae bacterium]